MSIGTVNMNGYRGMCTQNNYEPRVRITQTLTIYTTAAFRGRGTNKYFGHHQYCDHALRRISLYGT